MPFFTLLKRYWPELETPILLNTEKKIWHFDGFDIKCTQAQIGHENRLTWSECLLEALSQVETDLVLYVQEDYFIEKQVNHESILSFVELMLGNQEIKHIGLTHFGSSPPFQAYEDDRLWKISRNARYRLSTQAGLWRKEALKSYVLPWESGWMFEILGSIRATRRNELFLTIKRDAGKPLVVYQHTGIIKGQWSRFVEPLFVHENIQVDLTKRGFYDNFESSFLRRIKLLLKISSNPYFLFKSLFQ
jgi:hypothetical protein